MDAGCRNAKVQEVILSIWEIGYDCDWRVNHLGLQIFAEKCYKSDPTEDDYRRRFGFCTRGNYDDFMLLHEFDCVPGVPEHNHVVHPSCASEFLLWQDPLCGLFDKDIEGLPIKEHFANLEKQMHLCIERSKGTTYEHVFEFYRCLADVLALKSELGNQIRTAYLSGDKAELTRLADVVIPETCRREQTLKNQHRICWRQCGKALGWEIYDLHHGGVLARLDSAAKTIRDYLDGRIAELDEVAAPRLSYKRCSMGFAGKIPAWTDKWGRMVSASMVCPEYWLALPKAPYVPEDVG